MFITFEGIEGSGKSTLISFAKDYLIKKGRKVLLTKEPGGTKIGQDIRKILLDSKNKNLNYITELFLYAADRKQHLEEIILPALKNKKIILCDRFFDSTIAYQGYARGLDLNLIKKLHKIILNDFKPNLTILFDLPAEIGLKRAKKQIQIGERNKKESRFENEKLNFHKKVREAFLLIAKKEKNRFQIIDASKSLEEVKENLFVILDKFLKKP